MEMCSNINGSLHGVTVVTVYIVREMMMMIMKVCVCVCYACLFSRNGVTTVTR